MAEHEEPAKQSLLPYDVWAAEALRHVVVDALDHVARHGLPGGHHFYLTFLTGHPGVEIPAHLKSRFPAEITIVLEHQFWDLAVDRAAQRFSVGVSFGGVPATLVVPFAALTEFADPEVRFGLHFGPPPPEKPKEEKAPAEKPAPETAAQAEAPRKETPGVVSLDAFRRRGSPKE
ncbi:MAG: SspB family protein [Acetobacteraceae bacterium]